jgi:hypothetical protein
MRSPIDSGADVGLRADQRIRFDSKLRDRANPTYPSFQNRMDVVAD